MTAHHRTTRFSFLLGAVGLLFMISPHAAAHVSFTTFFVDPDGSDSNPGTEALPFRTISFGVSWLAPGDTLLITSGTYAESLIQSIPPGTSWSQPVTVAAYPGHTVILRPPAGVESVLRFVAPQAYIIVDGLILDGVNVLYDVVKITQGSDGMSAHHIRLKHCEIMNSPDGHGVIMTDSADYNEILFSKIHHNGNQWKSGESDNHGMYIQTDYNLVEGNEIYEHHFGYGIHLFNGSQSFNTIRRNRLHNNAAGGMDIHGNHNLVALNLFYNHSGIALSFGPSAQTDGGTLAAHNVVLGGSGALHFRDGLVGLRVLNNAFSRVGVVTDDTWFPLDPSNRMVTFVNPPADFHLATASAGVDVWEVPTDYDDRPWFSPRLIGDFR